MQISSIRRKSLADRACPKGRAGDEVALTRHGHPADRLVPVQTIPDAATCDALLDALRDAGAKAKGGEFAARSQDFLYGEDGLPR